MKTRICIIATALALLLTAGCAHPQPSPSPTPVIGWTWSLATGASASWTTTLYTATVASLTSQCPTPGGNAYKSAGTTTGNVGSLSDATETPGAFVCALTQNSSTCQGQPCYSPYSAISAVFAVPVLPTAPGTPQPTVTTAMMAPLKRESPHMPTMALGKGCYDCFWQLPSTGAPVLTASK